jgi:hypothetical protein
LKRCSSGPFSLDTLPERGAHYTQLDFPVKRFLTTL